MNDTCARTVFALCTIIATGCGNEQRYAEDVRIGSVAVEPQIEQLVPEIVRRIPHDSTAFTQGLVFHDGRLYESTGRYGSSTLRVLNAETGRVLSSKRLPDGVFGEGLAATSGGLVQLTWKEHTAYFYDPETLEVIRTVSYAGEGWGICHDGDYFVMSSGQNQLVRRDAGTFSQVDALTVTKGTASVSGLNELECVGDQVWANVYPTPRIIQIDGRTGKVVAEVDASLLLPPGIREWDIDRVVNGIAYNERTRTFVVTGKLWPVMYEVRFVPR